VNFVQKVQLELCCLLKYGDDWVY